MTKIISIIVVVIIAIVLMKIIKRSLRKFAAGAVEKHFRRTIYRIFQIIIWVVAIFVILGIWGINLTGLLAGAGFMGLVVGLAAQETLGNVISGMLMMFWRSFDIGDGREISG